MPKPVQHSAAKEKALELALLFPSWTVPRIYEELTALKLVKKRRGVDEPVPTLRTVQAWVRPVRQLDNTPWNPDLFSPAEFRAIALVQNELIDGRSFTHLEATHIARFAQIAPHLPADMILMFARQRILADAMKQDAGYINDQLIQSLSEGRSPTGEKDEYRKPMSDDKTTQPTGPDNE